VDEVRKNLETYPLEQAVPKAIEYCISNDILKDFLLANKAEVVSMSIFEYDEELHKKTLLQEGYEEGYDIGLSDGIEQGRKESREEIERLKKLLAEKEEMLS
ncbi:MAG: hypothetical protein IJV15_15560, partial [Lachnospiraceae bacterium]|nr:hypothetical protein [Lachnospiraceae bacterium]